MLALQRFCLLVFKLVVVVVVEVEVRDPRLKAATRHMFKRLAIGA